MNCLLVAATAKEIAPFLKYYGNAQTRWLGMDIDVIVTGVGLTATTYHLCKQLHLKRPGLVIQAGLGACFDPELPLGTVLAVKLDIIADESVVEQGKLKTIFELGLADQNKYPYRKGWLVNPETEFAKKYKLKTVKAISVNQITTNPQMIVYYRQHFDPVVESMEGAALHYVCLMEKIPFIQLRSISNYIGERNKNKWDLKESIDTLNKALIQLLINLP